MNFGSYEPVFIGWDSISAEYKRVDQYRTRNPERLLNREKSDFHYRIFDNIAWVNWNQHTITKNEKTGDSNEIWTWEARLLQKNNGEWKLVNQVTAGRQAQDNKFAAIESTINELGYQLLSIEKYNEAIKLFSLNVEMYPDSWNTYDSLAEVFMKAGKKQEAIENYKKSIELNPNNEYGKRMLKELESM